MGVRVFSEQAKTEDFEGETKRIAEFVLKEEGRKADINIIYVDDEAIRRMNAEYLKHDYVTDVISFPIGEEDGIMEGEVYICYDQAERQAEEYGIPAEEEAARLVIHGLLHLLGYDDKGETERSVMRDKENRLLQKAKSV